MLVDHLNEAQKNAYILTDNRMAMDAGWDEHLLRIEIADLQAGAVRNFIMQMMRPVGERCSLMNLILLLQNS